MKKHPVIEEFREYLFKNKYNETYLSVTDVLELATIFTDSLDISQISRNNYWRQIVEYYCNPNQ